MNVLVYAGPGTTAESVKNAVDSLRHHLSPYYAVVTVSEQAIVNDPWMFKTACLVLPGGADLPYCKALNGPGNAKIIDYVRKGGKFLGFCAGGYYGSAKCEFEVGTPMEVSGKRELGFYPGTGRGCAYAGFQYGTHRGSKIVELISNLEGVPKVHHYYNGGGVFVDPGQYRSVTVLAEYPDDLSVETEGVRGAVVHCKVNKGDVILTGTHPEFSSHLLGGAEGEALAPFDHERRLFMKAMLERLGLKVNADIDAKVPHLTSVYVVGPKAPVVLDAIKNGCEVDAQGNHEDGTNKFIFSTEPKLMDENDQETVNVVFSAQPPPDRETPYFSSNLLRSELERLNKGVQGDIGSVVGYGEVVTSTNTLMDGNREWLKTLPHGFTLTASNQIAGRGRGGNVWINPRGVLPTSVLFRVSGNIPNISTHIITLQYLCGLAYIESILGYGSYEEGKGVGYEDLPVRLKWPNDIYMLKPNHFNKIADKNNLSTTVDGNEEKWAKISGALVNSQYIDGTYHLVWGAGVNVSNDAPTISLNQGVAQLNLLREKQGKPPLAPYHHEKLLAKVLHTVDRFYRVFAVSGLSPFLDLYYKRWFHSNQSVRLLVDGKHRKVTVEGITPEYGCLVAKDDESGVKYELQPDGNSFDIFKGLVYKKT